MFVERTLKLVNASAADADMGMNVKAKKPNSQGAINRYPVRLRRHARRRALAACFARGACRAMSPVTLATALPPAAYTSRGLTPLPPGRAHRPMKETPGPPIRPPPRGDDHLPRRRPPPAETTTSRGD